MILKTNHPIAIKSLEYLHPAPHKDIPDRSTNAEFVNLIQGSVLDLGCGGGRFVKDCYDSGKIAVGLEGSPHFFNNKWSEWVTIPECLFLCDITKEFDLGMKFDVITAWEVLEHIPLKDLAGLFENVRVHLNGIFVVSISNKPAYREDTGVDYHVIKEDMDWWIKRFEREGFVRDTISEQLFEGHYVRNEKGGFHLVWKL